jgi:hypothetical protein
MKTRIALLTILCLMLAAIPALAQVLYDDGPINGTTDAWTINFGYVVGDSFTLSANSTVGGFNFGVWEYSGDVLTSVDWSITSYPVGGTVYGSATASGKSLTDQFISVNQYGYDIDKITVTGLNVNLTWRDHRQFHGTPCGTPGKPQRDLRFERVVVPFDFHSRGEMWRAVAGCGRIRVWRKANNPSRT